MYGPFAQLLKGFNIQSSFSDVATEHYSLLTAVMLSAKLIDQFADNLHVSPLERAYKCKVLAHYPENNKINPFDESAVSMLALPSGLRFRTQKHSVTQSPNFHSFLITREDGKRCYGFSLIFYEEVKNRDICTAMQTLQAMYITELSSAVKTRPVQQVQNQGPQSRSLPRHFKLNSQNPNGTVLTYYDIIKDKLFVSKSIGIICQAAYVQAAKIFLENLYRCAPRKSSSIHGLSLESYVFNLLHEIELPAPGKSLIVHLPPSDPHLPLANTILQNPAPPIELPHLDYYLRLMFTWLGVDIVVQLFTCLLLENQIILRSSDPQKLMVVAEGMTALLFPFSWPHVYVPILPAELHHFLDAPVPFLMGLYASSENIKVASEATLCYVDIDKCKVQLPEELPIFPHLETFVAEIWSLLDKYGVHVPNSESIRNIWDTPPRSCTLPGRPQSQRKLSIHNALDCDRPPSPPGSARSEALQRIADIVRRTGVALDKNEAQQPSDSYLDDMRFNNAVRETFLNRFVHIFQSYENFVIFPTNHNKEDWFNNRDEMQNFDKASFLSDQPEHDRLFLWRFLESQMFATLIDTKILSQWGERDNNLLIFDNRIKLLKQRYGGENLLRSIAYEPCTIVHETQKLLERRLQNPEFESPAPREVLNSKPTVSRKFPLLNADVLNKTPVVSKGSIPRARELRKGYTFGKPPIPSNEKTAKSQNNQDMSPALLAQANWTFVEKLLGDCKAKTKRMLLAKLGAEGVTLSSNPSSDSFGAVEENTLVAALCDFLERVWSHGLQRKRGKSALWTHLLAYQEKYQDLNKKDNNYLNADLPTTIFFDIAKVLAMLDVKTGIGFARAWVRLALEKKLLSRHLRTLLLDLSLLKELYKRSAFVRCEEEKEQFLYHLLSLNAVDYFCFTSTYPTTVIPYSIVIVPNKKGGIHLPTFGWFSLGLYQKLRESPCPRTPTASSAKIGTWGIGHDNSGLYSKWMVDYILVRNDVTGHTYRFTCGRWLGRGIDDGSTERLLVGTLMSLKKEDEETKQTGSLGRSTPRSRSPAPSPRPEMKPSELQYMLGDCVNNIVKWRYTRSSERHTTLTALLCSEDGLVHCLENVFLLGFKSARMFVGKNYLWDYFVRVKDQFEQNLVDELSGNRTASLERNHQETVAVWRCYCHLIDEIRHTSKNLGKDGKFQLFICLGVREHLLHRMLTPMSVCKVTQEMYEENSFLRKRGLLTFLTQILKPLDELDVVLENSVTHGISSPSPHV
ncbi:hypothetical protein YQE_07106, partial [Dendroctonus ponderosae]